MNVVAIGREFFVVDASVWSAMVNFDNVTKEESADQERWSFPFTFFFAIHIRILFITNNC